LRLHVLSTSQRIPQTGLRVVMPCPGGAAPLAARRKR